MFTAAQARELHNAREIAKDYEGSIDTLLKKHALAGLFVASGRQGFKDDPEPLVVPMPSASRVVIDVIAEAYRAAGWLVSVGERERDHPSDTVTLKFEAP